MSERRTHIPSSEVGCRWEDLNPQGLTATRPSTVRVYQFRHTDGCVRGEYSGVEAVQGEETSSWATTSSMSRSSNSWCWSMMRSTPAAANSARRSAA